MPEPEEIYKKKPPSKEWARRDTGVGELFIILFLALTLNTFTMFRVVIFIIDKIDDGEQAAHVHLMTFHVVQM